MRPLAPIVLLAGAAAACGAQNFAAWRWVRAIHLDTTSAGANVAGDVRNFPVAVALDASSFDFAQTNADGSDIRFSESRTAGELAHSIELWDRAARSALVWVKAPLARGASKQSIYMHWGNPKAPSTADSHAVFDTRDGFVGVWHLGEDGGVAPDAFRDATATGAHATGVDLEAGARVDGRLGKGLNLRHEKNQWVAVAGEKRKAFDIADRLTFSIWAKARAFSNPGDKEKRWLPGYETMFAKGDNSWRLQKFGVRAWHKPPADLLEICVERMAPRADLCVVGKTDMALDRWYHFTGVHDFPQAKFYVNGALDKAETFDTPWMSGDHPVGIGNQSQFPQQRRSWDGVLDEARVIHGVRDEHWIRLDYESQREGQKFLTFGRPERRR